MANILKKGIVIVNKKNKNRVGVDTELSGNE